MLILLGYLLTLSVLAEQKVTPVSPEYVCEGDNVPLSIVFSHPNSEILNSQFYKLNNGIQKLMIKDAAKPAQIFYPRVTYQGPTAIILRNVSAYDTGPYDTDVIFEDNTTDSHRFKINVSTGCPDRARFHRPYINYKFEGSGDWSSLQGRGDVYLEAESTLTLNVSIPEAIPTVKCTVTGDSSYMATGHTETPFSFYHAFYYHDPGDYTITVKLEHEITHPPSVRTIQVHVLDLKSSSTMTSTSTNPNNTYWQPPGVHTENETWNHKLIYLTIPAILVPAIIVIVCIVLWQRRVFRKDAGPSSAQNYVEVPMADRASTTTSTT